MRTNLKVLVPLVLCSSAALAEDYHSISDFDYVWAELGPFQSDTYTLSSTWYFDSKQTLGPLNEFEYINKTSNIFGSWTQFDESDAHQAEIGGEYFAGHFLLGGSYSGDNGPDRFTGTLGYLFSDNFLVSADALKFEGDDDTYYFFNARYNHQLSGTNYIGFNFRTDDEFQLNTISSRYFTKLSGESYLAAGVSYTFVDDFDDSWTLEGDYYFSPRTSLGLGVSSNDTYSFDFTHFFTESIALELNYATRDDDSRLPFTNVDLDLQRYSLSLTFQF